LALDPTIDRAWFGMGLAFVVLKQDTQAINAFREAAKLQPMSPYPKYKMGMAYHRLNQTDKVADVIQQLNEFDPKMTKKLIDDTGLLPPDASIR
jgi:tetratricopeptide (TPR) repeat protein